MVVVVVVRVEERETMVIRGEEIGLLLVVETVVARGAEGGVVGGAKKHRLVFVAHVALDFHYCYSNSLTNVVRCMVVETLLLREVQ